MTPEEEAAFQRGLEAGWIACAQAEPALYTRAEFTSHSGVPLRWKIECDALTREDLDTLAWAISLEVPFSRVIGVPTGGLRIAESLKPYATPENPTLIVDDVFTTGQSMEEMRSRLNGADLRGVVLYARNPCPEWIRPVFQLGF